jgi:putative ABC transport system permease protein
MVHAQRGQIGFLRAVGFYKRAIAVHYTMFSLLIGVLGGLIGSLTGHYLGVLTTKWYTSFLQVPYYDITPRWGVVAAGFVMTCMVTLIAGLIPARHAANLPPAEAIGVEAPTSGRAPTFEKHFPFMRRLSLFSRLPLRNFLRNPRRSFSTVAGVASAVTLLLVASGLLDSTTASIDYYFKYSIHYSALASYLNAQSESSMSQVATWKGVKRVEPALAVPGKLVKNGKTQTILIYGLRPGDRLMSLTSANLRPVPLPKNGLMIAESTAKKLGLWKGGTVRLTLPKTTIPELPEVTYSQQKPLAQSVIIGYPAALAWQLRPEPFSSTVLKSGRALLEVKMDRLVRVEAVSYQPIGNSAYASIDQVRRWYGSAMELPPKAINAIAVDADPKYIKAIERKLYNLHGVAAVQVTQQILDEIDEMMKSSRVFFDVMLTFSIALAGIIMFNSTLMNVIERTREIATLRTVGVSVRSAALMILMENLLAYVCGVIIGIPFGTWLGGQFVNLYESESFSMKAVIFPRTYAIAVVGILITVLLAQIPGLHYIRKIEIAKATKDIG